ncbi:MAG: hypothetical protein OXC72_00875, partial [Roseovarius sp.]|nr:hypothetical protein [Roseovarius sp.]
LQDVTQDNEANASNTHVYRNEKLGIEEAKHFDVSTEKARLIEKTGNAQIFEMKTFKHADHREVLMVFTRADVGNAKIDHASGELVKIEEISRKSMPLIYQSALAEQRIKSEIRSGESVFQKGFVVDVNLRMRQEKPRAYAVVEIHDVIDLSRAG